MTLIIGLKMFKCRCHRNCQMSLFMTTTIELKIFKLFVVLLEHLISQLDNDITHYIRLYFGFQTNFNFFFQIKYFGLKLK